MANREKPISDRNGVLSIGEDGNLILVDGNGRSVWSTNASVTSNSSTAILMDTGNLILSSSDSVGDGNGTLWQTFDHPTDTFLPGMRVYVNSQSGERQVFTSWKNPTDPAPGNYSMGVDPRGSPQIVIWVGPNRRWRTGHWTGISFIGIPNMRALIYYGFKLTHVDDGNDYFTYITSNSSDLLRFRIGWEGREEQLRWDEAANSWNLMQTQPSDDCELYNNCGNNGKCRVSNNNSICSCLDGFVPKEVSEWSRGNWTRGCSRRVQLGCERNTSMVDDGFLPLDRVKLPDFSDRVGLEDKQSCEEECLKNCSCKAYSFVSGIGCMIWKEDLLDIQQFEDGGETLYVRLANSELGGGSNLSKFGVIAIVIAGVIFLITMAFVLWRFNRVKEFLHSKWKTNKVPIQDVSRSNEFSTDYSGSQNIIGEGKGGNGPELPLFNFKSVATATNNFSDENKLGQGGFGPVYKGKLPDGQEIAVKRLGKASGQGLEEFKNEIILIAKLQHRNLVRLLGCCIQGEEKMLLYEYMPNKSLDYFLFDPTKQGQLDWKKRFSIIEGIARGLLYLHRDSRLRIIHRDLKASNILLDEEMNPKISDFGMARIFGGNQHEANTMRVVGTYGYMSPEYAMEGLFSVKSDVYSFGVLLLEIISSRRNTSFRLSEDANIIGYAWKLWNEGRAIELVDPSIADSCCRDEVLRCIQVGMLCVEESANSRPSMPSVVLMLESENATLPLPRQPTFTSIRSSVDIDLFSSNTIISSKDASVSVVTPR